MKRMDKFYNETYLKLETAIQELEIETDCPIKRIEAVIHHIIQSLADLKDFVLKNDLVFVWITHECQHLLCVLLKP